MVKFSKMRRISLPIGVALAMTIAVTPVVAQSSSLRSALSGLTSRAPSASLPAQTAGVLDTDVAAYAILASNSASVATGGSVTGGVLANGVYAAPSIEPGFSTEVERNTVVNGDVVGDKLKVDTGASTGARFCNSLTGTGSCFPFTPPALVMPPFQEADVRAGAPDVFVNTNEEVTLAPGGYGDITVGNKGRLIFEGGQYDVRSIKAVSTAGGQCLAPCRSYLFNSPSDVRIGQNFDSGLRAKIGPSPASGIAASDIIIYAGGSNPGGALYPAVIAIGRESDADANLYSARGTNLIERASDVTGGLFGLNVQVDKDSTVAVDNAFANRPPIADNQEVATTDNLDAEPPVPPATVTITLTGSDPDDDDLVFTVSALTGPGTLGPLVEGPPPSAPSPPGCSGEDPSCTPGNPARTSATITYTPADLLNAPNSFTFTVTDPSGASSTATVSINPPGDATPEVTLGEVTADDQTVEVVLGQTVSIALSGSAPNPPGDPVTYTVTSLPSRGTLADSADVPINTVPTLLSDNIVKYTDTTGAPSPPDDTFGFRVDGMTSASTSGFDTATVTVVAVVQEKLAQSVSVSTGLNESVFVTVTANPLGSGTAPESGGAQPAAEESTASRSVDPDSVNGTYSRSATTLAATTALGIDQGWFQFGWCDVGTTPNCDVLDDLVNETAVDQGPFEFTATGPVCLSITDTLAKGDHWRVENVATGHVIGETTLVPQATSTTSLADVAFADPTYSSASFDLAEDDFAYSIQLITIPPNSYSFGTAGFIRVDSGPCTKLTYEVKTLPAGGTLRTESGALVAVGDTFPIATTLRFVPTPGVSGTTSFTFEVSKTLLNTTILVDSALAEIIVGLNDSCVLVGREPGCAPAG